MQQLTQVIARLGLGGVGPEEEGQVLALLGNIVVQHEVGEQRLQTQGGEAGYLLIVVDQVKVAEQSKMKNWLHNDMISPPTLTTCAGTQ
ncbi:hypothetical protein KDH_76860 [Dictyobacter sp. S3.2.2.5]|uniref:Uncharacterized protein n=1 Tax=Dictyobacter halimunensis TaxID=3026934 RepID=A0ABQ6G6E5_9CHLR|nr:hypothetical protein KDH_76860 [Dictyobacter sp. S3.2.2.5]